LGAAYIPFFHLLVSINDKAVQQLIGLNVGEVGIGVDAGRDPGREVGREVGIDIWRKAETNLGAKLQNCYNTPPHEKRKRPRLLHPFILNPSQSTNSVREVGRRIQNKGDVGGVEKAVKPLA
jgi:hypothetical protein